MATRLDQLDSVVDGIIELNPTPRKVRWSSISLCILDAVWSISADYDNVVVPLVRRFAAAGDIDPPLIPATSVPASDPGPASRLEAWNEADLISLTNKQRTSTRGGVTKARAAIEYARILSSHGVDTLADAAAVLDDSNRLALIEEELSRVKGDGQNGIRRGYLWMLVGDDNRIKPDRMILRWFARQGIDATPALATAYIKSAAPEVTNRLGRRVTPWEIDHAIWSAVRAA